MTVTTFLWSLKILSNKFVIGVLYFIFFSLLLVLRFGAGNYIFQMWIIGFVIFWSTNWTLCSGRTVLLKGLQSRPLVIGSINSCVRTHIGIALSPAVRSDCISNNSWIWSLPSVHTWSCISVVLLYVCIPYSTSIYFKGRSVHIVVRSIILVIWPVHLVSWGWGLNIGVVVTSVCIAWSCWTAVYICCFVFSFFLPNFKKVYRIFIVYFFEIGKQILVLPGLGLKSSWKSDQIRRMAITTGSLYIGSVNIGLGSIFFAKFKQTSKGVWTEISVAILLGSVTMLKIGVIDIVVIDSRRGVGILVVVEIFPHCVTFSQHFLSGEEFIHKLLGSWIYVGFIEWSNHTKQTAAEHVLLRKNYPNILTLFISFKVYSFVTIIFINNNNSKRIFFTLFMPFYLFIVIIKPKTLNFINKSFYFFHFRLLVIICKLHNSFINYSTFSN